MAGEIGNVTDKHLATLRAMLTGMASRTLPATATEETEQYEFTLKPTYHAEAGALIKPSWFEVP